MYNDMPPPKFKLSYGAMLQFNKEMKPLLATIVSVRLSSSTQSYSYDLIVLTDKENGILGTVNDVDEYWLKECEGSS
jgi:hypothetical protein